MKKTAYGVHFQHIGHDEFDFQPLWDFMLQQDNWESSNRNKDLYWFENPVAAILATQKLAEECDWFVPELWDVEMYRATDRNSLNHVVRDPKSCFLQPS